MVMMETYMIKREINYVNMASVVRVVHVFHFQKILCVHMEVENPGVLNVKVKDYVNTISKKDSVLHVAICMDTV
jgi:hypothetical protein